MDGGEAQIITAVEVRPATEGDAQAVVRMLTKHRLKLGRSPRELVADAGYASDATWNACLGLGVQPTIAMRPVLNRSGGLNPDQFTYIPERDLYICPEGKELGHKTLAFEKRRVVYRPKRGTCSDCPLKAKCAPGRGDRSITRRWEIERYEAMKVHLRKRRSQSLLRRRKTVSERVFAHAKEQHGFGSAQFRGRGKMQIQALLTASAMNLKQLVRRSPEAQAGRAVIAQRSIPGSQSPMTRPSWRPTPAAASRMTQGALRLLAEITGTWRTPSATSSDLGRQVLIFGHELAPPLLAVGALSPGDVCREILGMDLPPGAIGSDPVQRQAADFDNQDCLISIRSQRGIDDFVERRRASTLPPRNVRFPSRDSEPPRGLARLDAPGAFPVV